MSFLKVVKARQSIRAFAPTSLAEDKLNEILEAANRAPSAGNLQAYELYVATQASRRAALAGAAFEQAFVADAPVVLVFCAHPERSARRYDQRGARLYALQDATIACTYAMLAATALGLASVWIGAFDEGAVRKAIGAPETHVPVALLPIGYAAEKPAPTMRRPLDDLVHRPG